MRETGNFECKRELSRTYRYAGVSAVHRERFIHYRRSSRGRRRGVDGGRERSARIAARRDGSDPCGDWGIAGNLQGQDHQSSERLAREGSCGENGFRALCEVLASICLTAKFRRPGERRNFGWRLEVIEGTTLAEAEDGIVVLAPS